MTVGRVGVCVSWSAIQPPSWLIIPPVPVTTMSPPPPPDPVTTTRPPVPVPPEPPWPTVAPLPPWPAVLGLTPAVQPTAPSHRAAADAATTKAARARPV